MTNNMRGIIINYKTHKCCKVHNEIRLHGRSPGKINPSFGFFRGTNRGNHRRGEYYHAANVEQ